MKFWIAIAEGLTGIIVASVGAIWLFFSPGMPAFAKAIGLLVIGYAMVDEGRKNKDQAI